VFLLGTGAVCIRARAQDATFSTTINVVNVLVTVRDKQGQLVSDLTQGDFTLEEDGRAQTIKAFQVAAGVQPTGELDDETRRALVRAHGA